MKRTLTTIGCFAVVAALIIGSIICLGSARERWVLGIVLGLILLFVVVNIPHNLRIWRARKVYRNLPQQLKDRVFELIQEAAAHIPSITYLLLGNNELCSEPETAILSHVGGVPYAESGETWPDHPGSDPVRFLLQARLDEPSLGHVWQGRLIAVFLVFDSEQIVRSYAAPSLEKYVPIFSPVTSLSCVRLESIRFPIASDDYQVPMGPAQLCDSIPEIKALLQTYTRDVSGLLSQILRPNVYRYHLEAPEIAYEGGSPMLIQNPHDPDCDHCHQRMRFLFQFGEIIPGYQLADGGVGYVYGCDHHPYHCKGFIDSH
jgi:hypothetical protein